jgi:hypothetical protein
VCIATRDIYALVDLSFPGPGADQFRLSWQKGSEMTKADLPTVRNFFQDGGVPLPAKEIMACKKDKDTKEDLSDYDEIANGIGDGTLTYPDLTGDRLARARELEQHPTLRV